MFYKYLYIQPFPILVDVRFHAYNRIPFNVDFQHCYNGNAHTYCGCYCSGMIKEPNSRENSCLVRIICNYSQQTKFYFSFNNIFIQKTMHYKLLPIYDYVGHAGSFKGSQCSITSCQATIQQLYQKGNHFCNVTIFSSCYVLLEFM